MSIKIPDIPGCCAATDLGPRQRDGVARQDHQAGLPIYFCDPHSPWQRGTNENTNGCCANTSQGTDLSFYGPGCLDQVAAELNARPANASAGAPREELDHLSDPSTFVAATA